MYMRDHVFIVVVCENMYLFYLGKLLKVKLVGDKVKVYVEFYKGLPHLLCINFYDFIIHITHFHCNIFDSRAWKFKKHSLRDLQMVFPALLIFVKRP